MRVRRRWFVSENDRSPGAAVAAAGAVALVLAVERFVLIARRVPTGTDESLHVMRALKWAGRLDLNMPSEIHRTRGVSALLYIPARLTESVLVYRSLFVVLSLALPLGTFLVGRRFLRPAIAAWCAVLLGLSWVVIYQSIQLLPDVPAAVFVTLGFALYWRAVVDRSSGKQLRPIWPVAIALGLGFYFNFAYPALAGALIAVDFLLHERRRLFSRQVLVGIAALGLVLAPYLIRSAIDHGNPLAPIAFGLSPVTRGLGAPIPGGEPGYVVYVRWFFDPHQPLTLLTGLTLAAGIAVVLFATLRGWPIPRRDASALALWVIVLPVAIALLFHAERRYLAPAWPAFALAIGVLAQAVVSLSPGSVRRIVTWAIVAVVPVFGAAQFSVASSATHSRIATLQVVRSAAVVLRARLDKPCLVYTRYLRQFELDTRCPASDYERNTSDSLLREATVFSGNVYFASFENGDRQPAWLPAFFARHAREIATVRRSGPLGDAKLYRFTG